MVSKPSGRGVGIAALQERGEKLNRTIVMITTKGSKEMIAKAKQAGAKGWIVKPFGAELLIAAIEKLIAVRSSE